MAVCSSSVWLLFGIADGFFSSTLSDLLFEETCFFMTSALGGGSGGGGGIFNVEGGGGGGGGAIIISSVEGIGGDESIIGEGIIGADLFSSLAMTRFLFAITFCE